ncbi:MAG: chorismate synthase, partial [Clostridia bacterium]
LSKLALAQHGISIISHLLQVGDAFDDMFPPDGPTSDDVSILSDAIYPIINSIARESMLNQIESAKACGDSIGGVIECACLGVCAGLGSPIFDAVESRIAAMQFSIPAVRGVEFGSGFGSAFMRGSEANDEFYVSGGDIKTHTNNHGGVLGGISTGMPISFRVAFKPTPSIAKKQKTVDLHELHDCEIEIKGRHDPCVALRAVPVVEAGAAIVLLDLLMEAKGYENIR